jgi:hypothetical protein
MNQKNLNNKLRGFRVPQKGIYCIILERINSLKTRDSEIISFPRVFAKLCSSLQLNKSQAWELLLLLRDCGWIRVVFGHGVVIINEEST